VTVTRPYRAAPRPPMALAGPSPGRGPGSTLPRAAAVRGGRGRRSVWSGSGRFGYGAGGRCVGVPGVLRGAGAPSRRAPWLPLPCSGRSLGTPRPARPGRAVTAPVRRRSRCVPPGPGRRPRGRSGDSGRLTGAVRRRRSAMRWWGVRVRAGGRGVRLGAGGTGGRVARPDPGPGRGRPVASAAPGDEAGTVGVRGTTAGADTALRGLGAEYPEAAGAAGTAGAADGSGGERPVTACGVTATPARGRGGAPPGRGRGRRVRPPFVAPAAMAVFHRGSLFTLRGDCGRWGRPAPGGPPPGPFGPPASTRSGPAGCLAAGPARARAGR
jgi:hypothetical protein